MKIEPTYSQFGQGDKLAVVMSPVMTHWDHGEFFAPLTEYLTSQHYRVVVYDSLSLLSDRDCDLSAFAERWRPHLEALGPIDLLAGSALGGALVQTLLATPLAQHVNAALLISAPTVADQVLDQRLGAMAALARAGKLKAASDLLECYVMPAAPATTQSLQVGAGVSGPDLPCIRLDKGFGLLQRLDVHESLSRFDKPMLSVVGECSQLVRAEHVQIGARPTHRLLEIRGGGMRPLVDAPEAVIQALQGMIETCEGGVQ